MRRWVTAVTHRPSVGALRRREAVAGVLFIAPWLISLLVFTAYPVIAVFALSFTDFNLLEPPRLIGLSNYEKMFTADDTFWTGVGNSTYYALLAVPLRLGISLALALLMSWGARGIRFY